MLRSICVLILMLAIGGGLIREAITIAQTETPVPSTPTPVPLADRPDECEELPAFSAALDDLVRKLGEIAEPIGNGDALTMSPEQIKSLAASLDVIVSELDEMEANGSVPDLAQSFHEATRDAIALVSNFIRNAAASGWLTAVLAYSDSLEKADAQARTESAILKSKCGELWSDPTSDDEGTPTASPAP